MPKWGAKVKFVLIDIEPSARDASKAAAVLRGDATLAVQQLTQALSAQQLDKAALQQWRSQLASKVLHAQQSSCSTS